MEKKDYLLEELTTEEIKYIRAIIWKTVRRCKKEEYIRNKIEGKSIFDEDLKQRLLFFEDKYDYRDDVLLNCFIKGEGELRLCSIAEKNTIVSILDKIAFEPKLNKCIKQLTYEEKLVVFLLFIKEFKVNEVAKLLNISRYAVSRRKIRIKEKIKKGMKKDGK